MKSFRLICLISILLTYACASRNKTEYVEKVIFRDSLSIKIPANFVENPRAQDFADYGQTIGFISNDSLTTLYLNYYYMEPRDYTVSEPETVKGLLKQHPNMVAAASNANVGSGNATVEFYIKTSNYKGITTVYRVRDKEMTAGIVTESSEDLAALKGQFEFNLNSIK